MKHMETGRKAPVEAVDAGGGALIGVDYLRASWGT